MPAPRVRVAIVGATGYVGGELTSILADHPGAEIIAFVSSTAAGQDVAERLPVWRRRPPMRFLPSAAESASADCVFFAAPNDVAIREAPALLARGKTVIDLGAAFRLADVATYNKWYGDHAAPDLPPRAVYGLPEIAREELKTADLIACPGCYATAAELALLPLAAGGMLAGDVIVDAKSGLSGAGRRADRPELLLAEMAGNFKAYALQGHRHLPEILQTLRRAANGQDLPNVIFVPQLAPIARGIHANVHAAVKNPAAAAAALADFWRGAKFVEVLPPGMVAELSQVVGGNRAILSAHPLSADRLLISVVIDNLQKGAAGQAVQNMNIRFGLGESAGLSGALAA